MSSDTTVIIRCKLCQLCFQNQFFTLSGFQVFGFCISNQLAQRLAQFALGCLHIDLYGLSARYTADICHLLDGSDFGTPYCQSHGFGLEPGIRQAKSKGIFYFISGKGLKITIADINILGIEILYRISEILRGRIILNIYRNSIAEFTAGIYFSRQDICGSSATLLATLPYIEHSLGLIAVHPLHIHDIAYIQHDNGLFKGMADIPQDLFLCRSQQVTSFRGTVVLVFSGRTSDNHNGQIRLL